MQTPPTERPEYQDARALPAPPAALWTFAVIFGASVLLALLGA